MTNAETEVAEAREWIAKKTGVGGGTRPLSFLIASHEQMARERAAALSVIANLRGELGAIALDAETYAEGAGEPPFSELLRIAARIRIAIREAKP